MIYFIVGVSLLLGSSSSVRANELRINEPECGIPTQGMIVNGTAAKTNQFPWMVYLALYISAGVRAGCGGSILTKRHILTAGHCTHTDSGRSFKAIHAYYGNSDWTRGKRLIVGSIIRHPKYRPGSHANDIALMLVEKPFEYGSNARPICIPTAPMNIVDTNTLVAGWGNLKENGQTLTPHLQYTSVRVLPNDMCAAVYYASFHSDVMFCAYRKGTDSCQGDSGGPAMSRAVGGRYVQVGIVSFGIGCARPNIPGVYTRVETFASWLAKVVRSFNKAYSSDVALQLASHTVPQSQSIFLFV